MSFKSLASTAILFGSAALARPSQPLNARQVPTMACATGVHVLAVSGDGATNVDQYGLIGALATDILDAIPGSSNVTVPYNKTATNRLQATDAGVCMIVFDVPLYTCLLEPLPQCVCHRCNTQRFRIHSASPWHVTDKYM